MKISIVVPIINEADGIEDFYNELKKNISEIKNHSFFIIFILDKSGDKTEEKIKNIILKDNSCSCLIMSSIFGHQACLFAGLDYSKDYDATVTMDGDMQHPPYLIKNLINSLEEGFDIVSADRADYGKTNFLNKNASRLFYKIFHYISDISYETYNTADFRIINKRARDILTEKFTEKNIFMRGLIASLGFRHKLINYQFEERKVGQSKYNFLKKLSLLLMDFYHFHLNHFILF